jgi:hypothetical protein
MEFSISASCFFVESSMVDWEVLVWDEFCKCNRVDKVIERAVDVPLVGTKIEGYGQHVSFTLGSDIALDVEPASPRRTPFGHVIVMGLGEMDIPRSQTSCTRPPS